jgi:hypothetical protein
MVPGSAFRVQTSSELGTRNSELGTGYQLPLPT